MRYPTSPRFTTPQTNHDYNPCPMTAGPIIPQIGGRSLLDMLVAAATDAAHAEGITPLVGNMSLSNLVDD